MRNPNLMVRDAEKLAQALILDAKESHLSFADLIQTTGVALMLLRATYPGTSMEVLNLMMEAEATFQAVARPSEVKN